jgi:hypothetical protein
MGYSKDPIKRRRQLEALARNNPLIDVDALMASHKDRAEPTPPNSPAYPASPADRSDSPSGLLVDFRAVDADVADQDGELTLIFLADGADWEHPTLGIPIAEDAAIDLARAIDRTLGIENNRPASHNPADLPEEFEVVTLRGIDLDRPRESNGTVHPGARPGRVDLELTDADGREITVHLRAEHVQATRRWLKPGWRDDAPLEEFVVVADEQDPRDGDLASSIHRHDGEGD